MKICCGSWMGGGNQQVSSLKVISVMQELSNKILLCVGVYLELIKRSEVVQDE